jgi:DNA-binding NtrC family response regulator
MEMSGTSSNPGEKDVDALLRREVQPVDALRLTRPLEATPAERVTTMLVVTCSQGELEAYRRLMSHSNWRMFHACSVQDAELVLQRTAAPVVITAPELPDGTWKEVCRLSSRTVPASKLIVSARNADPCLWAEVFNWGAYDVLQFPLEGREVYRVVSMAWLAWKRECEAVAAAVPRKPAVAVTAPIAAAR